MFNPHPHTHAQTHTHTHTHTHTQIAHFGLLPLPSRRLCAAARRRERVSLGGIPTLLTRPFIAVLVQGRIQSRVAAPPPPHQSPTLTSRWTPARARPPPDNNETNIAPVLSQRSQPPPPQECTSLCALCFGMAHPAPPRPLGAPPLSTMPPAAGTPSVVSARLRRACALRRADNSARHMAFPCSSLPPPIHPISTATIWFSVSLPGFNHSILHLQGWIQDSGHCG